MKWIDIVTRKQNILLIYTKAYGWCEKMKKVLGVCFEHMLMVSHDEATTYYVYKTELDELMKILAQKIKKDKPGKNNLASQGVKLFQKVIDYLRSITEKDLTKVSNSELAEYFKNYFEKQVSALPFLVLPNFVDDIFVTEFQSYLNKNLALKEKPERVSDYINLFSTSVEVSYATVEEWKLLKIAIDLVKNERLNKKINNVSVDIFLNILKNDEPSFYNQLDKHTKKWEWLPIQAEEDPYVIENFAKKIIELINDPEFIKKRLEEIKKSSKELILKRKQAIKDLIIDKTHERLIDVFQEWIYLKDFRRMVISQERLYSRNFYKEIGKRLSLSGKEIRFLSPQELEDSLNVGKTIIKTEIIHSRMKMFVLVRNRDRVELLTGQEAQDVVVKELPVENEAEIKIFKGTPASPGVAKGKAKIVFGVKDIIKIESGDILVARQTTPDLLSAMKKVVAIVTDEGGLLSHAAIVSRELKVPCVVGTKTATKVLKDGDLIQVDANKGLVRVI